MRPRGVSDPHGRHWVPLRLFSEAIGVECEDAEVDVTGPDGAAIPVGNLRVLVGEFVAVWAAAERSCAGGSGGLVRPGGRGHVPGGWRGRRCARCPARVRAVGAGDQADGGIRRGSSIDPAAGIPTLRLYNGVS